MMMGGVKEPRLSNGTLNPGQKARGWINFAPPDDSGGFLIRFNRGFTGATVDIELGPADNMNYSAGELIEGLAQQVCACADNDCFLQSKAMYDDVAKDVSGIRHVMNRVRATDVAIAACSKKWQ